MANKNSAVLWTVDQSGENGIGGAGRLAAQQNIGIGDGFVKEKTTSQFVTNVVRNDDNTLGVATAQPELSDLKSLGEGHANQAIITDANGDIHAYAMSADYLTGTDTISCVTRVDQASDGQVKATYAIIRTATDSLSGITTLTNTLYSNNSRVESTDVAATPAGVWDAINNMEYKGTEFIDFVSIETDGRAMSRQAFAAYDGKRLPILRKRIIEQNKYLYYYLYERGYDQDAGVNNECLIFYGITDYTQTPAIVQGFKLFRGSITVHNNKQLPTASQVPSNWAQTNTDAVDYIQNKPTFYSLEISQPNSQTVTYNPIANNTTQITIQGVKYITFLNHTDNAGRILSQQVYSAYDNNQLPVLRKDLRNSAKQHLVYHLVSIYEIRVAVENEPDEVIRCMTFDGEPSLSSNPPTVQRYKVYDKAYNETYCDEDVRQYPSLSTTSFNLSDGTSIGSYNPIDANQAAALTFPTPYSYYVDYSSPNYTAAKDAYNAGKLLYTMIASAVGTPKQVFICTKMIPVTNANPQLEFSRYDLTAETNDTGPLLSNVHYVLTDNVSTPWEKLSTNNLSVNNKALVISVVDEDDSGTPISYYANDNTQGSGKTARIFVPTKTSSLENDTHGICRARWTKTWTSTPSGALNPLTNWQNVTNFDTSSFIADPSNDGLVYITVGHAGSTSNHILLAGDLYNHIKWTYTLEMKWIDIINITPTLTGRKGTHVYLSETPDLNDGAYDLSWSCTSVGYGKSEGGLSHVVIPTFYQLASPDENQCVGKLQWTLCVHWERYN